MKIVKWVNRLSLPQQRPSCPWTNCHSLWLLRRAAFLWCVLRRYHDAVNTQASIVFVWMLSRIQQQGRFLLNHRTVSMERFEDTEKVLIWQLWVEMGQSWSHLTLTMLLILTHESPVEPVAPSFLIPTVHLRKAVSMKIRTISLYYPLCVNPVLQQRRHFCYAQINELCEHHTCTNTCMAELPCISLLSTVVH
jgi:hypothetical protein